jgi:hypothetical protein
MQFDSGSACTNVISTGTSREFVFILSYSLLTHLAVESERRGKYGAVSQILLAQHRESCANICQHRTITFFFHFGSSQFLPFCSTLIILLIIKSPSKNVELLQHFTRAAAFAPGCC